MGTETGKFNSGTAFKEGKIYLFDKSGVTVVRPWGPPMAWRRTRTKSWRHVRPEIDVGISGLRSSESRLLDEIGARPPVATAENGEPDDRMVLLLRVQRTIDQYEEVFSAVPDAVRKTVVRFRQRQFSLLSFAYSCGAPALELLSSNPALGFMLATNWTWHKPTVKKPLRSAQGLLRKKRRDMLAWLQFSICSDAAVRILAKMPAPLIRTITLFYLRDALRRPEVLRQLGFLPAVTPAVVRVASNLTLFSLTTPALLAELGQNTDEQRDNLTVYTMGEVLRMRNALGREEQGALFFSHAQVHALHDNLAEEFQDFLVKNQDSMAFPSPPLSGTPDIQPVSTPDELIQEGKRQHNCVASYATNIICREVYIYRVLQPERATLSIVSRNGRWVISELKAARNRSVSPETRRSVLNWLVTTQEQSLPELDSTMRRIEQNTDLGEYLFAGDEHDGENADIPS